MAGTGPSLLSPTLRASAVLQELSSAVHWLLRAVSPPAPVYDPALMAGLKPTTVRLYRQALRKFRDWALANAVVFYFHSELDRAVMLYYKTGTVTRSELERLLSSLERVLPCCKGRLAYATAVCHHWRRATPPKHAAPLSWRGCLALAWVFATSGYPRVAAVLLLQAACGLRPSEAVGLTAQDLTLQASGAVVVMLGVKHGTKVRRPQSFVLDPPTVASGLVTPAINSIAIEVVRRLLRTTPRNAHLSSVTTVSQYRSLLRKATITANLGAFGITPHSPRVGWASERRLLGMVFGEIQEKGRWLHSTSLRGYLECTAPMFAAPLGSRADTCADWLSTDFEAHFPWWPVATLKLGR